jgi:hypothetical protein
LFRICCLELICSFHFRSGLIVVQFVFLLQILLYNGGGILFYLCPSFCWLLHIMYFKFISLKMRLFAFYVISLYNKLAGPTLDFENFSNKMYWPVDKIFCKAWAISKYENYRYVSSLFRICCLELICSFHFRSGLIVVQFVFLLQILLYNGGGSGLTSWKTSFITGFSTLNSVCVPGK